MSETIFNIHDTLLIATAFQSLLFVLLIMIAKHDRHISDYFLVGFFMSQIAITLHILISYGEAVRFIALDLSPSLFHIFDIAFWLEGPLLLWYTRSLLYKNFKLGRQDLLFLIPALAYILYIIVSFHIKDEATKTQLILQVNEALAPSLHHGVEAIREVLRVFFSVLCLTAIHRAQQHLRDSYSNIEKIDLGWLKFLVIAFLILRVWVLIVVLAAFISPSLGDYVFNAMGLLGNYMMFVMMSMLIFFSLTRSTIFHDSTNDEDASDSNNDDFIVDPKLTNRIEQHMLVEKPYLHHFLNLDQLASQLDMHPRALSTTIKNNFNTNFYEFINTYRIDAAKKMLADPFQKDKTMIDILGECGFNSKATYNTFFKKLVGLTPTQYRTKKLKELKTSTDHS